MGFLGFGNKGDAKPNYSDYEDVENLPVAVPVPHSNPAYNHNAPGTYHVSAPPAPASAPQQQQQQQQQQSPPQAQNNAAAMTNTHMMPGPTLTRSPMMMRSCPRCQQESRTRIRTFPTWQSWTSALVLLFVFWPLCWIPLVLDSCKQTDHWCMLCGNLVGSVSAYHDCCVTHRS